MVFEKVFEPFIAGSPVSVMFRGTLENVLTATMLDRIFEKAAHRQTCRELTFSACADLLGMVVTRIQPSVNAAYMTHREAIPVSVQALYAKLARVEGGVLEALVRETARTLAAIQQPMKGSCPSPLPGLDVRIVDGNHLAGTQHRLKELRGMGDAALPGQTLAVLDPQRQLIEEVVVCEDGHANQKPLFARLLDKVQPGQCWIADRDFSTCDFLFGVADRQAFFVVRQHGALQGELRGRRRQRGFIDAGVVYEQQVCVIRYDGRSMLLRRVTLKLHKPTRDDATEIHLLTNLPPRWRTAKIAVAYLSRWQIESAFQKLTQVLRCELNTLGYPPAALFGFCLAVVMYNALNTVIAALRTAHTTALQHRAAAGQSDRFSFYYLANEISGVWHGMSLVIAAEKWSAAFAENTPRQMAHVLLWLARHTPIDRYRAYRYEKKKTRRKRRLMTTKGGNVSTYRILQERKLSHVSTR
jgi:IS4 transposase